MGSKDGSHTLVKNNFTLWFASGIRSRRKTSSSFVLTRRSQSNGATAGRAAKMDSSKIVPSVGVDERDQNAGEQLSLERPWPCQELARN